MHTAKGVRCGLTAALAFMLIGVEGCQGQPGQAEGGDPSELGAVPMGGDGKADRSGVTEIIPHTGGLSIQISSLPKNDYKGGADHAYVGQITLKRTGGSLEVTGPIFYDNFLVAQNHYLSFYGEVVKREDVLFERCGGP